MSYLNGSDDWGKDTDETLGDVLEEKLEDKVKDGAKEGGKAALKGVDKLTDKISPVKNVKDKVKGVNQGVKQAIQKAKKKVKDSAKKLAKDGIKAVGKAVAHLMRGIISWAIANPIPALIILIIIILIFSFADIDLDDDILNGGNPVTNESMSNPSDLSDDDAVVILMADCASQKDTGGGDEEVSSDKEASAKTIYSIFHSYGFTNASIAGILGNLDCESGLDPSCIEGIYDEYGKIGPQKKAAIKSMSDYTKNILFPKYARSNLRIHKSGYKGTDGSYYCGMGLVQWTGPGAQTFLSTAKTLNTDWYTMDFQLAYMLSDTLYRKGFFSGWVNNQEEGNDVNAAKASGIYFAHKYEGNTSFDDKREAAAETWFGIIGDWGDDMVDDVYVDSITEMASQLGGLIEFDNVSKTSERCGGDLAKYDNSSLAAAAVSYAWPTKAKSYNNGTKLYQAVISGIWPGNAYFKACDRVVAGAVRWSGTDDEYPLVTSTQLDYLAASPKWELVGMADSLTVDDLQPGDVFILNGHTLMYVGEEAITAAYPGKAEAGSNSVSGSLDQRAASCNADVTNIFNKGGGDKRGTYHVYRCINPDNSSTYSSIGAGVKN